MTVRERDGALELVSDYGSVRLYADFDEKEIGTNCADSYYDFTIPMDEFLEFADRICEKLKEKEGDE